MKNLILVSVLTSLLVVEAYGAQIEGEVRFQVTFGEGEFFGQSVQVGDPVTLQFAYQSDAQAMPLITRISTFEETTNYTKLFTASYDLTYLLLDVNGVVIDLPEPKVSIINSESFIESELPVIFHNDVMYLTSPMENFEVNVGNFGRPADFILSPAASLPTDIRDFDANNPTFPPLMTIRDPLANVIIQPVGFFDLKVVPEPSSTAAGTFALLLLLITARRSHHTRLKIPRLQTRLQTDTVADTLVFHGCRHPGFSMVSANRVSWGRRRSDFTDRDP